MTVTFKCVDTHLLFSGFYSGAAKKKLVSMGELEKSTSVSDTSPSPRMRQPYKDIPFFFFLFSLVIFICLFTKGALATVWWFVSLDRNSLVECQRGSNI